MCSRASWTCFNLFLGFPTNRASNTKEKRPLLARNFSAKHYLAVKQHYFCPILLCRLFIDILVSKIDFVLTTRLVQTVDIE